MSEALPVKYPSVEWFKPINRGGKLIDIEGKTFGRLTVVKLLGRNKNGKIKWLCRCDCGVHLPVESLYLRNGHTKSCGCLLSEKNVERLFIHGMSASNEHSIYRKMIERCHYINSPSYKFYGARGIQVCNRWRFGENGLNGFQCFYKDMGPRPSKRYSLDRHPNHRGGYEPGNVRWATKKEQARNTCRTRRFLWNGEMKSLSDICEEVGVKRTFVYTRLQHGWTLERALYQPKREGNYYV